MGDEEDYQGAGLGAARIQARIANPRHHKPSLGRVGGKTMDWTKDEITFLKTLTDPDKIQGFLDSIDYNPNYECRSPRWVIRKRSAHCFEGALFAAAALEFLGYKPLIVDMKSFNDDDHVIAVFTENGHWGAVAKSNFTSLRYREPVYRSLRELIMSYFDFYFNLNGDKSLRSYSLPLDLSVYNNKQLGDN